MPALGIAVILGGCRPAPSPAPEAVPERTLPAPPSPGTVSNVTLHREALGTYSWTITSRSTMAQAWFDQGLRLMYGYARAEARRAFTEARRADPACAMCWWGEAWSMGPYLNGPMAPADVPPAFSAIEQARRFAGGATAVEQALIGAMRTRYAPEQPAAGRRGLDSAYADAMAGVYAQFDAHADVRTLYADALMLLEPRRGTWPLSKPAVRRIHEVLEGVLARDLTHPGACHAYIHATETTPRVGEAQRCAESLGAAIPAVSHINHMPSHTFNRVGRWGDATRANLAAVDTDRRAVRGEAFAIYPAHNLHMLLFSAAVDGQEAVAVEAARAYTGLVGVDGGSLEALTLVRFGRFAEVLTLTRAPTHPVHEGLWAFGRGLAHLRAGNRDSAGAYLARLDSLAMHTPASRTFRVHEPALLLGMVGRILDGEMLRTANRPDDAARAFRAAAALEARLTYDEPEPLPFTASDFLGALLLEMKRPDAAAEVYRAGLAARPRNGWSLFGLAEALRAAGDSVGSQDAHRRFTEAWARSTVPLRASRF